MNTKILIGTSVITTTILWFAWGNLPDKLPINSFSQELLAEETKNNEQSGKELPDVGKQQQNQEKDTKNLLNEAVKKLDVAKGFQCNIIASVEWKTGDKINPIETSSTKATYKKNLSLGVEYGKVVISDNNGNAMNFEYEYYSRIEGKFLLVKSSANEKWEKISNNEFSLEDEFKMLLDRMKNEKVTGEAKLNDKNCQIVESSLNPQGIQKIIRYSPMGMFPPGSKLINPSWKIWISKEDGYLYKSILTTEIQPNMPQHVIMMIEPKPQKPFLGVLRGPEIDEGLIIEKVEPESPAEKAGLKDGDILTHFDNEKVTDWVSLQKNIDRHKIGDEVKIKTLRDKKEIEISLKLGVSPGFGPFGNDQNPVETPSIKITREITASHYNENTEFVVPEELEELLGLMPYLGLKTMHQPKGTGLVITEVIANSPADRAGLERGQLISEVAGQTVNNNVELHKILKQYKIGDEVKIKTLTPDNVVLEITVKLGKSPESK